MPASEKSLIYKFMERYGFMAKRDFFSFFLFLAAVFNCLEVAYWFVVAGLHLVAIGVLISQHKMLQRHQEYGSGRQDRVTALDSLPVSSLEDGP